MKILHAFTGSVASILGDKFREAYEKEGHEVTFMATNSTADFLGDQSWEILTDEDEREAYLKDQEVLHIKLRDWADALVIAPCSANTLAKIANGMADNLVTCVARAWPVGVKKMVVAPSMNSKMWEHPITSEHRFQLLEWGCEIVYPVEKTLYCGETGVGAMAYIDDILMKLL